MPMGLKLQMCCGLQNTSPVFLGEHFSTKDENGNEFEAQRKFNAFETSVYPDEDHARFQESQSKLEMFSLLVSNSIECSNSSRFVFRSFCSPKSNCSVRSTMEKLFRKQGDFAFPEDYVRICDSLLKLIDV